MEGKFIQIMPIKNMYAKFKDDDKFFLAEVICLGLTDDGEIHPVEMDGDGCFDSCHDRNNFESLIYSRLNLRTCVNMTQEEMDKMIGEG